LLPAPVSGRASFSRREILLPTLAGQIMVAGVTSRGDSIAVEPPVALLPHLSSQSEVGARPTADRPVVNQFPQAAGRTIHVATNRRERIKGREASTE
jgi:hypothetical protein